MEFRVGNRVILNIKNIKTKRNNKGLNYKNLGSFIIKRIINNTAYKLDLSCIMASIFLVFYL